MKIFVSFLISRATFKGKNVFLLGSNSFLEEYGSFCFVCLFVCAEVLWPSQPKWGHVERGQFT